MQIIYTEDKEDRILTVKKLVKLISCKFIRDFTKKAFIGCRHGDDIVSFKEDIIGQAEQNNGWIMNQQK